MYDDTDLHRILEEEVGKGRDARLAALGFERFLVFEGFFWGDNGLPESEPFVLGCPLFVPTSFAIISSSYLGLS
jgi:hypothetical protein